MWWRSSMVTDQTTTAECTEALARSHDSEQFFTCKLCGCPSHARGLAIKVGICSRRPVCRRVQSRAVWALGYDRRGNLRPTGPGSCTQCGRPLNRTPESAEVRICSRTSCYSARMRCVRQLARKRRPTCRICGEPIQRDNTVGVCSTNDDCAVIYKAVANTARADRDELRRRLRGATPMSRRHGEGSPTYAGGRFHYCPRCGKPMGWRWPSILKRAKGGPYCGRCPRYDGPPVACEVCGVVMLYRALSGVCGRTPECRLEKRRRDGARARRRGRAESPLPVCDVCCHPMQSHTKWQVCRRTMQCRRERNRRLRQAGHRHG